MDIRQFLIDEVEKTADYVGHPTDKYYFSESDMVTFAEKYHQAKLKLLGIADVVGRSEQLKCYHYDHEWKSDGQGGNLKYCNDCKCYV